MIQLMKKQMDKQTNCHESNISLAEGSILADYICHIGDLHSKSTICVFHLNI